MHEYNLKNIFGIPIASLNLSNISSIIISKIESEGKKTFFYVNAHCLNLANRNPEYKQILRSADLVYSGGIGPILASIILGDRLDSRTPTPDFIENILKVSVKKEWSFYLLGTTKPSIAKAANILKEKFPDIKIVGFHSGFFSKKEEANLIKDINKKNPTIILVGMGSPKQETWIFKNRDKLNAKVFWSVGALFDVISGKLPRAPLFMRKTGLEWFYRLSQEPGRLWKRYTIGNIAFIKSVLLTLIFRKIKVLIKKLVFIYWNIYSSYPKNVYCPSCSWSGRSFIPFRGRANEICPKCEAKSRHRFLYLLIQKIFKENIFPKNLKVLHVAPEVSSIGKLLENKAGKGYLSIDLNPGSAMEIMDITNLNFPENHFDFIFLSHVLEHIKEESKALSELKRVLKKGGTLLICVPLSSNLKKTIEFDKRQIKKDPSHHLREYGLDFFKRLEKAGFKVEKIDQNFLLKKDKRKYSIGVHFASICRKTNP